MGSFIAGVIGLKVRPEPFETFANLSKVNNKAALFLTIKVPLKFKLTVPIKLT